MLKALCALSILGIILSGCNDSSSNTSNVSGKAIDGYIVGAKVIIRDKNDIDNNLSVVETTEDGSFTFTNTNAKNIVIEISGGVDTSTGEAFTGTMKNVINADSADTNMNVTPLTSLVAELVVSGKTVEEAQNTISNALGINISELNSDPIETLKVGTPAEKTNAAKMMKNILAVQKLSEIVSSVSSDKKNASANLFLAIAEQLQNNNNLTLDSALDANNTDSLLDDVKAKSTNQLDKDKFEAIKELTKNSLSVINDINVTELAQSSDTTSLIKKNASAIEVMLTPLKEKLATIKEATNATQIELKTEEALNITKATIALGGIEGIATTLQNSNDSNASVSDFARSFLSNSQINTQSDKYNVAINSGKSIQNVIDENRNNEAINVTVRSFGSLKGNLYKESTGNNIRNGTEIGLSNITIFIQDEIDTKEIVTDENGYFSIDNVAVGEVVITIYLADTDMPEGAVGENRYTYTLEEKGEEKDIGDIGFHFGDPNSIDPSYIAECTNPISFTWDGSTVNANSSSKTIWEDMEHNNFKDVIIGDYTITLSYSDLNGQFNNIDAGTANLDDSANSDGNVTHGVFGSPYLSLYLGNDNDKNTTNGSLAKGDSMTMRVDFNDSVILDNWLFRDIDSGDIRNGESGWDWQDAVKIKAYDSQENPVELTIDLSETTNLQIVNGVVRTNDDIVTGPGTDTTDPKGHARWSSNGHAIKHMIVEFSSGTAIANPTRTAIAASGFSFCPVSTKTAPTLTIVPTTTTNDTVDIELHGIEGSEIWVNGYDTNENIGNNGTKTISLQTEGEAGEKTFRIELKKDGVTSDSLNINITKTIPSETPTRADAIKFLRQAAFRMNEDEIAYVMTHGYEAWIDNQFSMENDTDHTYMKDSMRILNRIDPDQYPTAAIDDPSTLVEDDIDKKRMDAFRSSVFWDKAINDPHQLRQRIAYALSQIVVVSDDSPAGHAPMFRGESMIAYYDILYNHSFGTYRELLTDVTHSSAMGYFMTYIGGDKAAPDENYARELTQLFTVGLYELNDDGTLQGGGTPIPSFKQQHVTDLARVFTGWDLDDKQLNSKDRHPRYGATGKTDGSWVSPLEWNPEYHDVNSTLHLFHGDVTMTTTADGAADIETALDLIYANHNVAPHISRHLIMRFVTSNPTPAYVGRVTAVFNSGIYTNTNGDTTGSGNKGDLKAVIKAILLDDEARGVVTVANFGKVDEMLLAYPHFLSAFGVQPVPEMHFSNGNIVRDIFWLNPSIAFQQSLLGSDTVFNFYSNEFVPSDPYFANNNLVSPELQIQNTPNMIGYSNLIKVLFDTKEKYRLLRDVDRDGNLKYTSMLDWAQTINFGQFSLADGLYYVDLTPEYEVFEKALDNETTANGDFANMGDEDENIEDRARAINALLDHLGNKLLGQPLADAYKTQIIEHVQEFTHPKNDAGRKDRAKAIITISIQAIVTSPLFMVVK